MAPGASEGGSHRIAPSTDGGPVGHPGHVLHACTLAIDLRIPECHSLKAKRATVKHLVEGSRSRFGVAAAEVGLQDQWQRSELGFAAVSGSPAQVATVLDSVEQYVWSHPQVEVVSTSRAWIEIEG